MLLSIRAGKQQVCVFVLKWVCVCRTIRWIWGRSVWVFLLFLGSGVWSLSYTLRSRWVCVCVSMGVPCYKLVLCKVFVLNEVSTYMFWLFLQCVMRKCWEIFTDRAWNEHQMRVEICISVMISLWCISVHACSSCCVHHNRIQYPWANAALNLLWV